MTALAVPAFTVSEALQARTSVRAYTPQPVPVDTLRDILEVARWAPSGGNLQPCRVIALAGAARERICALARRIPVESTVAMQAERPVYPPQLWEPYRTRRRQLGEEMYRLLGVGREDRAAKLAHWAANYEFFGAPVGLFFVIDERMGHAQWAHMGMLMLAIALAAHERGLGSCMQEAWASMRGPLARELQLVPREMIYCGMALGFADASAAVNRLRSPRMPVTELARFEGFA